MVMASGDGSGYRGGRVVGDYMFGRRIGSGSFSVVWAARHRVHGVEVAVKEIVMDRLSKKLQESLLSEIVILKRIKHPNIIAMHDIIEASGRIYLILEYCRGGDLSLYIQRHGRVSEAIAKHFMQQLANGLQVLRDNNLIHRDLKPQNLLLSTMGDKSVLKIADFGFARSLQPLGLAETLCGSPLYMAPEIMQLQKYDAKADLWSVGAILFQLVTGKTPFTGNTETQLLQNIVKSNDLHFPSDIKLSHDCIDLCKKLLRRNPVERLIFEEFFNHPFLSESRSDDSLRHTLSIPSAECTTGRPSYQEEDCMPFPLEDESGVVDRSLSVPMNTSVRSTYGFIIGADKDSPNNTLVNLGAPSEHTNKMETFGYGHDSYRQFTGDLVQANVSSKVKHEHTIADSLDLVDQDYVIVSGPPLEMSSSSIIISETQNSPFKSDNSPLASRRNSGLSSLGAAVNKVRTFGSLDSRISLVSGTSQVVCENVVDTIEQPSANCMTRVRSLQQSASVIAELVKGEIENGRRLEAFSVQLVLLAIWKQALHICHMQAASFAEGSPSYVIRSQENRSASPRNRYYHRSSDSQMEDAVSSEIEREFLLSVEHAEELEKDMGQEDETAAMPDAIEIIFQSALALGRLGAVDEMKKAMERAETRYSNAVCLLQFLLVEAPSLVLNPPLSLTSSDRYRLRTYINIINKRRTESRSQQMAIMKCEQR